MSISAKDVMKLREATGAGMMDCKKALAEADGNFDKAVEILRKKGQQVSEKRANRDADQGLVLIKISYDYKKAAAIELNWGADCVVGNEEIKAQDEAFLNAAFEHEIGSVAELNQAEVDGPTVENPLDSMVGKIGDEIESSKVVFINTTGSLIDYILPGNQLG